MNYSISDKTINKVGTDKVFFPNLPILLHAAAVKTPHGALLFLGPSKAGKTTICNLLASKFEPIADDTVYALRAGEGRWLAASKVALLTAQKHHSGSDIPADIGSRILATMRIYKDCFVAVEPIGPKEHCFNLINAVVEAIGHSANCTSFELLRQFRIVACMAKEIQGLSLKFIKGNDTSTYLYRWQKENIIIYR